MTNIRTAQLDAEIDEHAGEATRRESSLSLDAQDEGWFSGSAPRRISRDDHEAIERRYQVYEAL
jgi:hypothetical protein